MIRWLQLATITIKAAIHLIWQKPGEKQRKKPRVSIPKSYTL